MKKLTGTPKSEWGKHAIRNVEVVVVGTASFRCSPLLRNVLCRMGRGVLSLHIPG